MTTDALALPVTPSRAVAAKALAVPVELHDDGFDGVYVVASGTTPGKTYAVTRDSADGWTCSCAHGSPCSHVYAAMAHADPAVRRALLARVRPARRMGRDAAERLVERYNDAWLVEAERDMADDGPGYTRARKRRLAIADKLVARLTGNDDGDE